MKANSELSIEKHGRAGTFIVWGGIKIAKKRRALNWRRLDGGNLLIAAPTPPEKLWKPLVDGFTFKGNHNGAVVSKDGIVHGIAH